MSRLALARPAIFLTVFALALFGLQFAARAVWGDAARSMPNVAIPVIALLAAIIVEIALRVRAR